MDDLSVIEVGKIFPGSVPAQQGAQMELLHDTLTVLGQMPGLNRDQLKAFHKGFKQYSYLESDTPIPVALTLNTPFISGGYRSKKIICWFIRDRYFAPKSR